MEAMLPLCPPPSWAMKIHLHCSTSQFARFGAEKMSRETNNQQRETDENGFKYNCFFCAILNYKFHLIWMQVFISICSPMSTCKIQLLKFRRCNSLVTLSMGWHKGFLKYYFIMVLMSKVALNAQFACYQDAIRNNEIGHWNQTAKKKSFNLYIFQLRFDLMLLNCYQLSLEHKVHTICPSITNHIDTWRVNQLAVS